ncbi:MAG: xylulose 5-phosphate 3-epimerase [Bacilli bacterium]|nr:xylulose 5-phosphate 3-epimerase [Bacilli bacterium]
MKKAVNQWCFPNGTSLEEVFKQSIQAGFDGVELNLYAPGEVGFTLDTSAAEAERILKLASSYGLELKSLSTGLLWASPLSSSDPELRAKGRAVVAKQLEIAGLLGMETILVVPGNVDPATSYEVCYSRSQEELKQLLPLAEKRGITIGIENVWNKFLLSPLEMARYIDEFGSSFVGAYFDVGNVLQFGYPEQWIRILGSRIKKVHVKDFSRRVGNITGFVPLLSGDVNWKEVRAAFREIGYDGYITAELSPYALYPQQMIQDTSSHMSAIIES